MNSQIHDISMERFGRLTALHRAESKLRSNGKRRSNWLCKCDCGNMHVAELSSLKNGGVQSCGCLKRELSRQRKNVTHGECRQEGSGRPTKEYVAIKGAIARCYDTKATAYKWYGGRGIKVCNRWRDSYSAFLADMGRAPAGTTLDRKDPDGDYEPGNCRWLPKSQQSRNRRSVRTMQFQGLTCRVIDLSEKFGVAVTTITARLAAGWDSDRAATEPARRRTGIPEIDQDSV